VPPVGEDPQWVLQGAICVLPIDVACKGVQPQAKAGLVKKGKRAMRAVIIMLASSHITVRFRRP
jgi:hypothetical protein